MYKNDALTAPLLYHGDDTRLLTQEKKNRFLPLLPSRFGRHLRILCCRVQSYERNS